MCCSRNLLVGSAGNPLPALLHEAVPLGAARCSSARCEPPSGDRQRLARASLLRRLLCGSGNTAPGTASLSQLVQPLRRLLLRASGKEQGRLNVQFFFFCLCGVL